MELGTIGVIISLILGTIIFFGLNYFISILYFGPLAIFGVWLGCTVVAYVIVGWFSGTILGFFSILWTLIKIGLLIAAIVYVYKKLTSKKKTGEEN